MNSPVAAPHPNIGLLKIISIAVIKNENLGYLFKLLNPKLKNFDLKLYGIRLLKNVVIFSGIKFRLFNKYGKLINRKNKNNKISHVLLKRIKNEIIIPNQAFLEVVRKIETKIKIEIIK